MVPNFWKLSQGPDHFSFDELLKSIDKKLIYIHTDSGAKGQRYETQAEEFINASIGDYFYLTHGNQGIYLIGQIIGPANIFSEYAGYIDRPFRLIFRSINTDPYEGQIKWWTPNENSTFVSIPGQELPLFEEIILKPYFNVTFKKFNIQRRR